MRSPDETPLIHFILMVMFKVVNTAPVKIATDPDLLLN